MIIGKGLIVSARTYSEFLNKTFNTNYKRWCKSTFDLTKWHLKNKEDVTLKRLSKIFPGYEKYRNWKLINHLKDIVDGDLIIEKRKYILKDWQYE